MRLADIIQEAFLLDINSSLLLEADRISYKEDYSLQPLSVIASYVILAMHRTSFQWELEVYQAAKFSLPQKWYTLEKEESARIHLWSKSWYFPLWYNICFFMNWLLVNLLPWYTPKYDRLLQLNLVNTPSWMIISFTLVLIYDCYLFSYKINFTFIAANIVGIIMLLILLLCGTDPASWAPLLSSRRHAWTLM